MDMFATNFTSADWLIAGIYLVGVGVLGVVVNKYIHNVSDYMVGGRGSGAALNTATFIGTGLGLVTIMYASIDGFRHGFTYMVLPLIGVAVGLTVGSTGFVVRRLRQYGLTTLPEYFQRRYSRNVRVTAGVICAAAGILNMGLFPKMGAIFITYATGLGRTRQVTEAQGGAARPKGLFQFGEGDILDWNGLCAKLWREGSTDAGGPGRRIIELRAADAQLQAAVHAGARGEVLDDGRRAQILGALNEILANPDFYRVGDFDADAIPDVAEKLLKLRGDFKANAVQAVARKPLETEREPLSPLQVQLLNRLLLEGAYPDEIAHYGARRELMVNVVTSILIALVLLYTVLGGMVSVIVTDYLQFVILSIGLGLGLYFCLSHPDLGWGNMVGALSEFRGERAFNPFHAKSYGWVWVVWMVVHVGAAVLCWAPEATRALTARDPTTSRRTFLLGAPGQYIRLALPALFAIAAFCMVSQHGEMGVHFFPEGLGGDPQHADQAMPLLLAKVVPAGLLGLLVAGLMAAFMSTHDSYLLCWSSVITRDVVAPLKRRELSDREQIRIARILILCIGVFLLVWGVWYELPASVWNYMAVTGTVYLSGSIVILVGGMYWRRASSTGAIAALLGGLVSVVLIFLPDRITTNTMLMGLIGLGNYAFCIILFVAFSLLYPEAERPSPQEAQS